MKNFIDQALDYLINPNLSRVLNDLDLNSDKKNHSWSYV